MNSQPGDANGPLPLVSVVIPTFNSKETIEQTIESVLSQSLANVEVIVCDDCSTDTTAEIVDAIRQRDSRVTFSRGDVNFGGPAAPRNRGMTLARGEWIAFLDSDDLWVENKLRIQIATADKIGAEFICAGIEDFWGNIRSDDLRAGQETEGSNPMIEKLTYEQLLQNNTIPTSTVLIKTSVLLENGLKFKADKNLIAVEDYELWLRILSLPLINAVKIRQPLVFYRRAETSISKNKLRMFLKVKRILQQELESRPLGIREMLIFYYLSTYVSKSFYYRLIKRSL